MQDDPKNEDLNSEDDDDFGVFDPKKHVSFDEKIKLAEMIRKCNCREKLTQVVNTI